MGQRCDGVEIEQRRFVVPGGIVPAVQFHTLIVGAELLALVLFGEGFPADGVKQPVAVEDKGAVGVAVPVPKRVVRNGKVVLPCGAGENDPKSESAENGD